MTQPNMYVIVAFSRENELQNVIKNFTQQRLQSKKLIIVENGSAKGTCKRQGFTPDVLLSSGNHQALAKNEAIQWIRNHGGGWWATFDDDDYYGPGYLEKIWAVKDKAEIIGQSSIFVRTIGGRVRLFSRFISDEYTSGVHGSTICAHTHACPYFSEHTGVWGEDWQFIADYKSQGARVWSTSPHGHMLKRHASNTWPIQDEGMVRFIHFATRGKCEVLDYGPESAGTISVVDGETNGSFEVIEPTGELQLEDAPSYQRIKDSIDTPEVAAERLLKQMETYEKV